MYPLYVDHKGFLYEYADGKHSLTKKDNNDVFYLTHAFETTYIPKSAEVIDVIEAWIKKGI